MTMSPEFIRDLLQTLAPAISAIAVFMLQRVSGKLDKMDHSINLFSTEVEVSKLDRKNIWERIQKMEQDLENLKLALISR